MNPNLAIHQIMTSELITVSPDVSLLKVKAIFENHQFHHLPVISSSGSLVGIISRMDFFKVSYLFSPEGRIDNPSEFEILRSGDIMTEYPVNLEPDDSIGLAADIFLANKFHALPIVEDGKLLGIVTSHDLLSYCFNSPVENDNNTEIYTEE